MVAGIVLPPPEGFYNQEPPSAYAGGEEAKASETAFAKAAANPTKPGEFDTANIRSYMEQNGVDVTALGPATFLANPPSGLTMEMLEIVTQSFASDPATSTRVATQWSAALSDSGFETQDVFQPTSPMGYKLAAMEGMPPRSFAPEYVTQEESGWIQFKSGVLVNPADGSVIYKPGTNAPGSPTWMTNARETWSEERINEERAKLIKLGYLDPAAKKGPWDTGPGSIEEALGMFHYQRYLHGGDVVPMAGAEGSSLKSQMGLTARDFDAQIRNDVREQFTRVYGDEPSEEELRTWSDFITKTSLKLQRKYIRKDVSPGEARAAAATEAEERFIEKIEQSPEAVYLRENYQENTRLRDSIEQGVIVANSLMG